MIDRQIERYIEEIQGTVIPKSRNIHKNKNEQKRHVAYSFRD